MSEVKYKLKDGITELLHEGKFDVSEWTEDMKVKFQESMFSLGISWSEGEAYVQALTAHYYYTRGTLLEYDHVHEIDYFQKDTSLQLFWQDIFEPVDSGVELDEGNSSESLSPEELVGLVEDTPTTEWTDKHYDNYYTLTEEDIEEGKIRIDAYFVNRMWKLNSVDDTGAAFHSLKTYARLGNNKNTIGRELNALNGQLKRWAKLMNVKLK